MNRPAHCCLLLTLLWPAAFSSADQPGGSWLQLQRLNQASQQSLQQQQRSYAGQRRAVDAQTRQAWERLQRQQLLEQQALQQDQQRQRLIQEQQRRVVPTIRPQRLQGLFQQQRFRQAQERQLQRFETQQQLLPRQR